MSCNLKAEDLEKPLLLTVDNFTPLSRTPWGGTEISRSYKDEVLPGRVGDAIGEAWEFSCDPQFPSRVRCSGDSLLSVVEEYRDLVLSPESKGQSCEILVKLLNAKDPLSLQVHPEDRDANLSPKECGKPESWYVLKADQGAGLYLGFAKAIKKEDLKTALLKPNPEDMKRLLQFVPVAPGDYFEIEPGVVHAIGGGVTLLEPQRILPGLSGKTYRLWDWGRKYNPQGELDMAHGVARALHIEESLGIIDSQTQVGMSYVDTLRRKPTVTVYGDKITVKTYPKNPYYQLAILEFKGISELRLSIQRGYGAITCLNGLTALKGVALAKGETAILPARCLPLSISSKASSCLALLIPASAELGFEYVG